MVVVQAECSVTVTLSLLQFTTLAEFERLVFWPSTLLGLPHYFLCTVSCQNKQTHTYIGACISQ